MVERLFLDGEPFALERTVDAWITALRAAGVVEQSRVMIEPTDPCAFIAAYQACSQLGAVAVIQTYPIARSAIPDGIAAWCPAGDARQVEPMTRGATPRGCGRVILQTSGSTGVPKYVLQRQDAIRYQTECIIERLGYADGMGFLLALPPWSAYGLTVLHAWQVMNVRLHVVRSMLPRTLARVLVDRGIDVVDGTPQLYQLLVRHFRRGPEGPPPVGTWCCGGDSLTTALAREWASLTGRPLLDGYGSSEAGGNIAINGPACFRMGTVGTPYPGTELRIAQDGEILVRSPSLSSVLDRTELLDEPAAPQWLATGDLGRCDDEFVTIVGRKKNVIVINGYKVSPETVERVVREHPHVRSCVVRPVLDAGGATREISAVVETDTAELSERALRAHCREHLPAWAVPHRFSLVDAVSYSRNGKLDRRQPQEGAA